MNYATAPIAADLGIGEPLMATIRRAAAALRAAIHRANERKCYRKMLQDDDLLRDIGVTREHVRRALAAC